MLAGDRVIELAYTRLSGDSTLSSLVGSNISRPPMDQGTAFPYIVLGSQSDTPLETLSGTRVFEAVVLRVNLFASLASGQGWAMLRQIADRVDTLLQEYGDAVTSSVYVVKFRLTSAIDQDFTDQQPAHLQRTLLYKTEAHPS